MLSSEHQYEGVKHSWSGNFARFFERRAEKKLSELSWGRPVPVSAVGGQVFATDAACEVQCLVSFDNASRSLKLIKTLNTAARDVAPINASVVAVALDDGTLELIDCCEAADASCTTKATMSFVADARDLISELAVSADSATLVAGDHAGNVYAVDVGTATQVCSWKVPNECLSVKANRWVTDALTICTGLDAPSQLIIADTRTASAKLTYQSDRNGLFTTAQLGEHSFLLGYERGDICQLDTRNLTAPVCTVTDPFVQAIGHIELNEDQSKFVVSGLTDYTVYSNKAGVFHPIANESGSSNVGVNTDGYSTSAIFLSNSEIFSTNSKAGVSINSYFV